MTHPMLDMLEARRRAWWSGLGAREQRLVLAVAALAAVALLWWIGLAPALGTLSAAGAEHARLDAQLQRMTQLQAQAKALQSQPRASRDDALRDLEASVRQSLGGMAQFQSAASSEGAAITLRGVPADKLAQWFAQARGNARAVPREVHLTRGAQGGGTPAKPEAARWDGNVVMNLPAR
jgi:general secretion pathway protein M